MPYQTVFIESQIAKSWFKSMIDTAALQEEIQKVLEDMEFKGFELIDSQVINGANGQVTYTQGVMLIFKK
jgi:hypothetical protein